MKIIREDESIFLDITELLHKWHSDISHIFSGLRDDLDHVFDEKCYQDILNKTRWVCFNDPAWESSGWWGG